MFPVRKESREESAKPIRRRAQTDDSIRNELMRQQLAEDRRKKLQAAMSKPKRDIQAQSLLNDNYSDSSELGKQSACFFSLADNMFFSY